MNSDAARNAPVRSPGQDNFMRLLGFQVEYVAEGEASVTTTVREEHLNLHGTAHGGFLYSLADAAFALASNSRPGSAVALNVNMQYFKAVRAGSPLAAHAREVHLGRQVASYQIDLHVGDRLVAAFSGTVFRLPAPADPA